MKFALIQAEQAWPVSFQCEVLGVSRSGFYAWCTEPVSARGARDAGLLPKIQAAFLVSEEAYGSPRITKELRDNGEAVSKGVVERVMRDNGITPARKRRFMTTTDSKHDDSIAPNLLDRTTYPTRSAAMRAIGLYIDGFYNVKRRHSTIGYVSPIAFELNSLSKDIESMAA